MGVLLIAALAFVEYLYIPLHIDHSPERAEAIVVLSSGGYGAGVPNMRTLSRLHRGLELYRAGYAPLIICLGGTYVGDTGMTVSEQMKESLLLFGVEEERIAVEDSTQNTYNDLNALYARYKGEIDFNKILFVTSSSHTSRVRAVLLKLGIESPIVVSAAFWEREPEWSERGDLLAHVIREYLALLYFWMRGWV